MKIKAKNKDSMLTVKVKLLHSHQVDSNSLTAFSRKAFKGFLRPNILKPNLIEYTGPEGISLADRLSKPISKYDFLYIVEQITEATNKLQKNKFPWNKIVWDLDNMFINTSTNEVQLLYVTIFNDSPTVNILGFLSDMVARAIPSAMDAPMYLSDFANYLRSLTGYDPDFIDNYIQREAPGVANAVKQSNAGQSGFMTDKKLSYYEHYNNEPLNNADYDEATGLLVEDSADDFEATGLLNENILANYGESAGISLSSTPAQPVNNTPSGDGMQFDGMETSLLVDDEEDGTALLAETPEPVRYAQLQRVLTQERISINKPVFRIGKERSYVDYFVTNNNAVSRSHADIVTRGKRHFVIDLNSKNRTYINNKVLPVQVETEIFDGDHLKIANEEFIFSE